MSRKSDELEAIVKSIFNSSKNKEDLSVKVIKNQVADKLGHQLSKEEAKLLKEFVCDLYESYTKNQGKVFQPLNYCLACIDECY